MTARRAVIVAGLASAALFALLLVAAPADAADGGPGTGISLIQALLIGFGYYLSNSPWLTGNGGFLGLYRPLVAGFLVGIILGDPLTGAQIGAAINVLYIAFISAGGSAPSDPSIAGWVGTAIAMGSGLDAKQAIALGAALGTLGTLVFFTRMSVDAAFAHWADARAEEADIGGVARANWLPPQILLFLITVVPAVIAVYYGAQGVSDAITWLNDNAPWVLRGLEIAGGLLPAIGIAMTMRFIFRGAVIPYFFLGYLLAMLGGANVNIVVVGVIGAALAVLHVSLVGDRRGTPAGADR
jgi:mannose/fructose/N-acetylgalactosamine-specific phosphotransferase system component IIC